MSRRRSNDPHARTIKYAVGDFVWIRMPGDNQAGKIIKSWPGEESTLPPLNARPGFMVDLAWGSVGPFWFPITDFIRKMTREEYLVHVFEA